MSTLIIRHCCATMDQWISDDQCPLMYYPNWRAYRISAPSILLSKNAVWKAYKFTFCPACGTKLPLSLLEYWANTLKQEYSINDLLDNRQKRCIPLEFQTDIWWKKRGFEKTNVFIPMQETKQHDCNFLQYALTDDTPLFFYDTATKTYTISAPIYLLKGRSWPHYQLMFCPWCGGSL